MKWALPGTLFIATIVSPDLSPFWFVFEMYGAKPWSIPPMMLIPKSPFTSGASRNQNRPFPISFRSRTRTFASSESSMTASANGP